MTSKENRPQLNHTETGASNLRSSVTLEKVAHVNQAAKNREREIAEITKGMSPEDAELFRARAAHFDIGDELYLE